MTQEALPSSRDFLLKVPLYEEFFFKKEDGRQILYILYFKGTYDSYCTKCQRESTFQSTNEFDSPDYLQFLQRDALARQNSRPALVPDIKSDIYRVKAKCTRQNDHIQDFLFFINLQGFINESSNYEFKHSIQKVGQQPSFADVHLAKVKKYTRVLTKIQIREFNRAIGLASHGVGIGAYVYLRRIFEALVEEAHVLAKADDNWNEEDYFRGRMGEKIDLIKAHLPNFLSQNPEVYGLLSKGIHELSEDECLKHFDTLRICIELILDEKLERKERDKKIEDAKTALAKAIHPKT
jgi:hypothetical protein